MKLQGFNSRLYFSLVAAAAAAAVNGDQTADRHFTDRESLQEPLNEKSSWKLTVVTSQLGQ